LYITTSCTYYFINIAVEDRLYDSGLNVKLWKVDINSKNKKVGVQYKMDNHRKERRHGAERLVAA
jgi:hypothetical protein